MKFTPVLFETVLRGKEVEVYMKIIRMTPTIQFEINLFGEGALPQGDLTREEITSLCRQAARISKKSPS
jgi:hypothetical protein